MSVSTLSYQNVRIKPFPHMQLLELAIVQQVNEHGKLTFTGVVAEEHKDNDLFSLNEQTPVQVMELLEQGGERILFSGIITESFIKLTVSLSNHLTVKGSCQMADGVNRTTNENLGIAGGKFFRRDFCATLNSHVLQRFPFLEWSASQKKRISNWFVAAVGEIANKGFVFQFSR